MSDATRDVITPLRAEHKGIMRHLGLLSNVANGSRSPTEGKLRELAVGLDSQLRRHFNDEEKNLYRPLKSKLGKGGPIDEMMNDHRSIYRASRAYLRAASEYEAGRGSIAELQLRVNSLEKKIRTHLAKEEKVLFWLADLRL